MNQEDDIYDEGMFISYLQDPHNSDQSNMNRSYKHKLS